MGSSWKKKMKIDFARLCQIITALAHLTKHATIGVIWEFYVHF